MSLDGIAGTDFMSKYQCQIDFSRQRLQIGRPTFNFERNLVFPEQEAKEINQITHPKLAPIFLSDEVVLGIAQEEVKIAPLHEQIFNSIVKYLNPEHASPAPGQTTITEKQFKLGTGKSPLIVVPGIANVIDDFGSSLIPIRVMNLSAAPLIINKGRALTSAS